MTSSDRLALMCFIFVAVAMSVAILSPYKGSRQPLSSRIQPAAMRTGNELCAEVEHELGVSVRQGIMAQERADAIVNRCFKLFGETPS